MQYDGNTDKVIHLIKHAMVDTRTQQRDIVEKTGLNKGTISNFLNYKGNINHGCKKGIKYFNTVKR